MCWVPARSSDDDPASDYKETIADTTDPLDDIEFTTSANRIYTLQSRTSLVADPWMDVPDQINITGSGGIDTLTYTPASAA